MIQKDGSIVISEFQKGIGKSPIIGNGHIVNADIFETEGVLKIGKRTFDQTTFDVSEQIPIARTGDVELLRDGKIYNSGVYVNDVFGIGYDVVEWNGFYIFSGNSGGTGDIWACKTDFTIGTHIRTGLGYKVYLCKAQDGYVYYTNGYKIGRITNLVDGGGFITATYSDNVLNLPQDEIAVSLVELGVNLLVGTEATTNAGYTTQANIYPWDRVSSSFNLPVKLQENGIQTMIAKDNLVYVVAGISGNIYVTNGSTYTLLTTLKISKRQRYGATASVNKRSISFNKNGKLLVGTSTFTDGIPNTTTYHGIWEIDIATGINHLAYTVPSGETGQNANLEIGYIQSYLEDIRFGYRDGTKYRSAYTTYYLNTLTLFESPIIIVGDYSSKKSYNELQWTLVRQLLTGQSIKIYYRIGLDGSWINIHTSDSTHVGKYSTLVKALIPNAEVIQIKIELLATGINQVDSPELIRVLLR